MLNSEIIKNIIKNNFSILENFSYKYRVQNQKIWKYFLEKKSFSLVEYSNQELNYQSLYRYEKKIDIICDITDQIPLKDKSMELIFSRDTLEHLTWNE